MYLYKHSTIIHECCDAIHEYQRTRDRNAMTAKLISFIYPLRPSSTGQSKKNLALWLGHHEAKIPISLLQLFDRWQGRYWTCNCIPDKCIYLHPAKQELASQLYPESLVISEELPTLILFLYCSQGIHTTKHTFQNLSYQSSTLFFTYTIHVHQSCLNLWEEQYCTPYYFLFTIPVYITLTPSHSLLSPSTQAFWLCFTKT